MDVNYHLLPSTHTGTHTHTHAKGNEHAPRNGVGNVRNIHTAGGTVGKDRLIYRLHCLAKKVTILKNQKFGHQERQKMTLLIIPTQVTVP